MKNLITLFSFLFISVPLLAQEIYSKKEIKTINKGIAQIEKKYDEFDEETAWNSPILKNIVFYKYKNKSGKIVTYLRMNVIGVTLNTNEKGLTIIFEDGSRFERPNADVDVDADDLGWEYRIFETLTDEDLKLFSSKKIKAYKLYIYQGALSEKDKLLALGWAKGIIEAK